jgi:hypothetical protein
MPGKRGPKKQSRSHGKAKGHGTPPGHEKQAERGHVPPGQERHDEMDIAPGPPSDASDWYEGPRPGEVHYDQSIELAEAQVERDRWRMIAIVALIAALGFGLMFMLGG